MTDVVEGSRIENGKPAAEERIVMVKKTGSKK